MKVAGTHTVEVHPKAWGQPWSLWPLGDIHWGAKGCDKERVKETIERIRANPRAIWIGMGDYFDMITLHDKRIDPEALDGKLIDLDDLNRLADKMVDIGIVAFLPIKAKCIGLLAGNHETKTTAGVSHAVRRLAEDLNVPYLGYCTFVDILWLNTGTKEEHRMRIGGHHGAGAARTKGGKVNRVEAYTYDMDADMLLYGHIHARFDDEVVELGANADCTKLVEHRKIAVATGTFLRTYHADENGASSYGERAQYRPTPLGAPCISIVPETGEVSITKGFGPIKWR